MLSITSHIENKDIKQINHCREEGQEKHEAVCKNKKSEVEEERSKVPRNCIGHSIYAIIKTVVLRFEIVGFYP